MTDETCHSHPISPLDLIHSVRSITTSYIQRFYSFIFFFFDFWSIKDALTWLFVVAEWSINRKQKARNGLFLNRSISIWRKWECVSFFFLFHIYILFDLRLLNELKTSKRTRRSHYDSTRTIGVYIKKKERTEETIEVLFVPYGQRIYSMHFINRMNDD